MVTLIYSLAYVLFGTLAFCASLITFTCIIVGTYRIMKNIITG